MSSYYNGRRLDFRQRLIPRRPVRTPIRKPITPPTQHAYIQNKLILAIGDPAFELNLPELGSSFPLASNDERTEVLECIGDGLLHSVVALEIYKRYPKATAHFVTVTRAALNSNCTFIHFMAKAGAFVGNPDAHSGKESKRVADAFETLVAAFFFDKGFDALCAWVSDALGPLLIAAKKAFDDYPLDYPQRASKRKAEEMAATPMPIHKRRRSESTIQKRKTPYTRVRGLSPAAVACNLANGIYEISDSESDTEMAATPLPTYKERRLTGPSSLKRKRREIIDLTKEDDDDEDNDWVDCDDAFFAAPSQPLDISRAGPSSKVRRSPFSKLPLSTAFGVPIMSHLVVAKSVGCDAAAAPQDRLGSVPSQPIIPLVPLNIIKRISSNQNLGIKPPDVIASSSASAERASKHPDSLFVPLVLARPALTAGETPRKKKTKKAKKREYHDAQFMPDIPPVTVYE